jgi:hypothetical protein
MTCFGGIFHQAADLSAGHSSIAFDTAMFKACCCAQATGAEVIDAETGDDQQQPKVKSLPAVVEDPEAVTISQAEKQELEKVVEEPAEPKQNTPPGVPMVLDALGEEKTVYFTRAPLGFVFNKSLPIKINATKPGTPGEALGLQKDWVVKSFNGDDFTKLATFQEAWDLLKKHAADLPKDP